MAHINKKVVLREASRLVLHAHFVSNDPAVIKAAKLAAHDLTQAARSCSSLATELRSSWARFA